jgi:hypothetical protein
MKRHTKTILKLLLLGLSIGTSGIGNTGDPKNAAQSADLQLKIRLKDSSGAEADNGEFVVGEDAFVEVTLLSVGYLNAKAQRDRGVNVPLNAGIARNLASGYDVIRAGRLICDAYEAIGNYEKAIETCKELAELATKQFPKSEIPELMKIQIERCLNAKKAPK